MKRVLACLLAMAFCLVCLIGCGTKTETSLDKAKAYIFQLYKSSSKNTPSYDTANFDVVTTIPVGNETFSVSWEVQKVNPDSLDVATVSTVDGKTTIEIVYNEVYNTAPSDYKLIATITDGKNTTTQEFDRQVPEYKYTSYDQWLANCSANNGAIMNVKAYVIAVVSLASSSGGSLYLQDADGHGYYAYAPVLDDSVKASDEALNAEFPLGTEVVVSGSGTIYSGQYEFNKGCTVKKTGNKVDALKYNEGTADFTKAESGKDTALIPYQNALVILEGCKLSNISGDYYYFTVGDGEARFNIYDNYYFLSTEARDTWKSNFKGGYSATITGIVSCYSSAYQIYPISADVITNLSLPELDDAGSVAAEKDLLNISTADIVEPCNIAVINAGQSYDKVAISWASDSDCVKVEDGKLVVSLPDTDTVVTITATLTCGDVTDTKEFVVNVIAPADDMPQAVVLEKAFALEDGKALNGTQVLLGVVKSINTAYSESYNNITVTITVGDKDIQCFRMAGGADIEVGDTIAVAGTIKNYKGTIEFDTGAIYSKMFTVDEMKQNIVVDKAFALEDGQALVGKQILCGEIVSIDTAYADNYNNITVTINVNGKNIQCFRMTGGADLAVGQVITVIGTIKNYKGTIEFDKGAVYYNLPLSAAKEAILVDKAYALEAGKSLNGKQQLTGEITSIDTAYSESYGNITVTITVAGKNFQCFRMAGGSDLAVGDTITVLGIIKNYKGTIEFDTGATYTK